MQIVRLSILLAWACLSASACDDGRAETERAVAAAHRDDWAARVIVSQQRACHSAWLASVGALATNRQTERNLLNNLAVSQSLLITARENHGHEPAAIFESELFRIKLDLGRIESEHVTLVDNERARAEECRRLGAPTVP